MKKCIKILACSLFMILLIIGYQSVAKAESDNADKVTVIFDTNGGKFTTGETTKEVNVSAGELISTTGEVHFPYKEELTWEGHYLLGWKIKDSEDDTIYTEYFSTSVDTVLVAQWLELCTITYDYNGGTTYTGQKNAQVESYVGNRISIGSYVYSTPNLNGYVLVGWMVKNSNDKKLYVYDESYEINSDVTFVAQWKKVCKVTYDANGGEYTGGMVIVYKTPSSIYPSGIMPMTQTVRAYGNRSKVISYDVLQNSTINVGQLNEKGDICTVSRNGYEFVGWKIDGKNDTTVYINKQQYIINDNVTFKAQWKKVNSYTINGMKYTVIGNNKIRLDGLYGKDKKTILIPTKVSINGKKYKVVSIADNAFKGNSKVQTVTVGSSVTTIGKKAFYNCKKLKKIVIKSKKLKSVGSSAFKKNSKNTVIYCPKTKLKVYKKILKKKVDKNIKIK